MLKNAVNKYSRNVALLSSALASFALLANCTLKSPGTETPAPNNQGQHQGVDKSFFFDEKTATVQTETKAAVFKGGLKVTDAEMKSEQKTVRSPRTFLCNWAPESELGEIGERAITHNVPIAEHCNLQFEITEKYLVGRRINPSFPDDPSRWPVLVTIPIISHYYYERAKDATGRETNEWIENSNRSDWSARPSMKLDLSGMHVHDYWEQMMAWDGATGSIINVEDIEWDKDSHFLGFTALTTMPTASGGSDYQGRFRVNFLEYKHDDSFKTTPFNDKNYKLMNVLHIMGEKVEGVYQIMRAAHWDLTKPHYIFLRDFPDRYRKIAVKVVGEWNDALRSVGALGKDQPGFVISDKEIKHSFDLRYPTITWVSDPRISLHSPLGVGSAHADVKNGEILWGGITLWGGYIETYIKSYMSPSAGAGAVANFAAHIYDPNMGLKELLLPPQLRNFSMASREALSQSLNERLSKTANSELARAAEERFNMEKQRISQLPADKRAAALSELEKNHVPVQLTPDTIQEMVGSLYQQTQTKTDASTSFFANDNYRNLLAQSMTKDFTEGQTRSSVTAKNPDDAAMKQLNALAHGNSFDYDRTFLDVGAGWASEIADGHHDDYDATVESVVKELISHEYGHFLGLGHQFKESILPEEGTVPDAILQDLKKSAKAEAGYTNMTSVMGYRNPRTEIADTADHIKPGPQDKLVLAYLYTQKYATFKKGATAFTMEPIPASGIIPTENPSNPDYKTSYFPQCNDWDASVSVDPYCNRFDRGTNATEIVENYFKDVDGNLIQNLIAFTDARGGNAEQVESYAWWKSLSTLSRIRLFYDYMRRTYKSQIDQIRNDEDALYDFHSACQTEQPANAKLAKIFSESPELKELCAVNAKVLIKYKDFLGMSVVDYTIMDHKNRFAPGGMGAGDITRDWSRYAGTWKELTGLPLKISTLYAMTAPAPWVQLGPYMMTVPGYDDRNLHYAYSSLYPFEYTEAIAADVEGNLSFASLKKDERTKMGQSVLSLGWFNYLSTLNNDSGLFPKRYMERIRSQNQFGFNYVAVIVSAKKKDNGEAQRFDRFDGQVFDFQTGKSTNLLDVFVLPDGDLIANGENMFLYPISKLRFFGNDQAYVLAYKLDYFRDPNDKLADISAKTKLKEQHDKVMRACVFGPEGEENGLAQFFKGNDDFKGFYIPQGIATDDTKQQDFQRSVTEAFNQYYQNTKFKDHPPVPETCSEAQRGLGLIMSTAAIINGFWLPEANEFVQK